MKIQREYKLYSWDEPTIARAIAYLSSRNFVNVQISPTSTGAIVSATRGSWLGNFISFDMTKLLAKIRLTGETPNRLLVELDVNTTGQQIAEWNKAVWRLELVELYRILIGLGRIDDIWSRFKRDTRAASIRWTFTLSLDGRQLPESWVTELRELESSSFLASQEAA